MIIYKTTNLVNGKIYVGQDSNNNPKYLGSGTILWNAINKYGIENFKKEILEVCNSKEELNEREKFWIKELDAKKPNGYNITDGGSGGDTLTNNPNLQEIRKKFLKKLVGKIILIIAEKLFQNIKENYQEKEVENYIKVLAIQCIIDIDLENWLQIGQNIL